MENEKAELGELISELIDLMNQHGHASPEVEDFCAKHRDNAEFVTLAEMARDIKRVFNEGNLEFDFWDLEL